MPGVSDPQTLNWTAGISRVQEGVACFPVKQVDVFRFDRNGDRPNAIFNTNRSGNQEPGIRIGEHVGDCSRSLNERYRKRHFISRVPLPDHQVFRPQSDRYLLTGQLQSLKCDLRCPGKSKTNTLAPSATIPSTKFIAGEPINPATNLFTGLS